MVECGPEHSSQKGEGTALDSITFRGRFAYLESTHDHWPALLSSLPWSAGRLDHDDSPHTFQALKSHPRGEMCYSALLSWASSHGIQDEWILDAATQTLVERKGSPGKKWHYIAPELPIPRFD